MHPEFRGALDFVLSSQHPDQGLRKEWFNLFAPGSE